MEPALGRVAKMAAAVLLVATEYAKLVRAMLCGLADDVFKNRRALGVAEVLSLLSWQFAMRLIRESPLMTTTEPSARTVAFTWFISSHPLFTAINGLMPVVPASCVIKQLATMVRPVVAVMFTLIARPPVSASASMRQPSTIRVCCLDEVSWMLPWIKQPEITTWLLFKLSAPVTLTVICPLRIVPSIMRSDCREPRIRMPATDGMESASV